MNPFADEMWCPTCGWVEPDLLTHYERTDTGGHWQTDAVCMEVSCPGCGSSDLYEPDEAPAPRDLDAVLLDIAAVAARRWI